MSIHKIVLTGGPCGGKTSSLARIEQELTDRGYTVIVCEESATRIMSSGLKPNMFNGNDFQLTVTKNQLNREEVINRALDMIDADRVVVIYDRGIMDARAFCDENMFNSVLAEFGLNVTNIMSKYDCVIHLVTAAKGAEEYYTTENNKERLETVEMAIGVDNRVIEAWTGHSHLRIIDNSTDFKGKMDRVMKEIYSSLGEPTPLEIERKYLIEYPNIKQLVDTYKANKVEILQTYLGSKNSGTERRVRQRGLNGNYTYFLTEKKDINGLSRLESESKITKDEYLNYLMQADTELKPVRKDRYCFVYENQYFELDIYPFWKDKAILEIELTEENQTVDIPDFIKVIKEVTEDSRYKNKSLARYTDRGDL